MDWVQMAISYEQFMTVLRDSEARADLGLELDDAAAQELSESEARSIAYYENWSRKTAAGSVVPPLVSTGSPTVLPLAVVSFVLSLVALVSAQAIVSAPIVVPGFIVTVLVLSLAASLATKNGRRRGFGLAVAGIVLSALALLAAIGFGALHLSR